MATSVNEQLGRLTAQTSARLHLGTATNSSAVVASSCFAALSPAAVAALKLQAAHVSTPSATQVPVCNPCHDMLAPALQFAVLRLTWHTSRGLSRAVVSWNGAKLAAVSSASIHFTATMTAALDLVRQHTHTPLLELHTDCTVCTLVQTTEARNGDIVDVAVIQGCPLLHELSLEPLTEGGPLVARSFVLAPSLAFPSCSHPHAHPCHR